jgi:riboflavin transporter FmnP
MTFAMLSAMAYLTVLFIRIPIIPAAPFLDYDPKDIIIVIGGFLYGPMAAFTITVVVAFIQMVTVSSTAHIGFIMNVISGTAFCCTAAYIYHKKRDIKGAAMGLGFAALFATAVMMLYNYLLAPLFMMTSREVVTGLLLTGFLPFNLISNIANAALTVLIYKHIRNALTAARLMPKTPEGKTGKINWGLAGAAAFLVLSCIIWVWVLRN